MEHKHDPVVILGSIKCRLCGKLLSSATENVAVADSAVRANRILQEIAVAGQYRADSTRDGFVVYIRDHGNLQEELSVQKVSNRRYHIIKITVCIGGDG